MKISLNPITRLTALGLVQCASVPIGEVGLNPITRLTALGLQGV